MTTIAVRDGVMAADTLGSIAGKRTRANKLFRCDNGHIIGIDGYWMDGKLFVEWYNAGANRDEPPKWRTQGDDRVEFTALALTPDGVYWWSYELVPDEMFGEFWAIGSGSESAIAAMYCGLGSEAALSIAIQVDKSTGGDVETMELLK